MYEKIEVCPVCGITDLRNEIICKDHLISGESFALTRCFSCDLLLTNPRPDADSISPYYQSDEYISHNKSGGLFARAYRFAQTYTLWYKARLVHRLLPKGADVLDYGCGVGDFAAYLKKRRFNTLGVEPSPTARSTASEKGVTTFSSLSQLSAGASKFHMVTLWHVLEHIHDLNPTIKQLKKLLHKKGYLLVAVPNISSWDARHYNTDWAAFDVPRHLYHFSRSNIETLFKNHNIKLIGARPLYLDSFYISLLSEKYATGNINIFKSVINGCKSNIYGYKTGEYSSMIYILQRK